MCRAQTIRMWDDGALLQGDTSGSLEAFFCALINVSSVGLASQASCGV